MEGRSSRIHFLACALVAAICAGCAPMHLLRPWDMWRGSPSGVATAEASSDSQETLGRHSAETDTGTAQVSDRPASARTSGTATATGASASADPADRASGVVTISSLVAELESEGLLDAASKQRLIEDLQQTPPELWPQIIATFRATLAYRKRAAEPATDTRQASMRRPDAPAPEREPPHRSTAGAEVAHNFPAGAQASAAPRLPNAPPGPDRAESLPADGVAQRVEPAVRMAPEPDGDAHVPAVSYVNDVETSGEMEAADTPRTTGGGVSTDASTSTPVMEHSLATAPAVARSAAGAQAASLSWREHVEQAVAGLEQEARKSGNLEAAYRYHVRARLLEAALGRREEAMEPIPELDSALQDFWSSEFFAFSLLTDRLPSREQGAGVAEAQRHLLDAAMRLGELGEIRVRNLAFVTEVQSWGVYTPFEEYEFVPGQKTLLYAEVENLKAVASPKGYHTAWRASYEIFDESGRRIAEHEFSANEEYCRGRRRDFFIGCEFSIPQSIQPGPHTLRLTVADANSQRIGQGSIEFTVRGKRANRSE